MAQAFLVLRITGQADVPHWAVTTLKLLKLDKKFRATIIPAKDNTLGMLKKIQHYISWQEIDISTTKELLDKKARKAGYKKIKHTNQENDVTCLQDYEKLENLEVQELMVGAKLDNTEQVAIKEVLVNQGC